MPFTKGHKHVETSFTQADAERIWELYFGKRWSLNHIAQEYGVQYNQIAGVIDSESERRWRVNHPNETNRERPFSE
ncbi:MAG TPA: hypothetical protein VF844_20795 [Ktedonobacteraceae bacterium]